MKVHAENNLEDLYKQIDVWSELGVEEVTISLSDLRLLKECYIEDISYFVEELKVINKAHNEQLRELRDSLITVLKGKNNV